MLTKTESDLLYLMKCGIHKTAPDKKIVDNMDMEAVYELAKSHYIQAYIAWVLESMKGDYPLSDTWKNALNQAIHYRVVMDSYINNLFSFLEEKKCWFLPLKGYIIKDFYPAYGVRQMADIDILFDPIFRKDVKDYFVSKEFEIEEYKKTNHDAYIKENTYAFEMHVSLFSEYTRKELYEFFDSGRNNEHIIKDSYQYSFDPTGFYIYLIAHAYKHYSDKGTGVRLLLDLHYLFLNMELNVDEMHSILEQLKLSEFEKNIRSLTLKCFKDERLTDTEEEMLEYLFHSGTYGTHENRILNRLDSTDISKGKYIRERLFPGRKRVMYNHPFIGKSIVLIPFYWVYRFFIAATKARGKIKKELSILQQDKNKN